MHSSLRLIASPSDLLRRALRRRAPAAGNRRRSIRFESLETRTLLTWNAGADLAIAADGLIFVPPGEKPVIEPESEHESNFNPSGQKWPQPGGLGNPITITYSYSNLLDGGLPGGLTTDEIRVATEEALGLWSQYAPLHFVEADDSGPAPSTSPYSASDHPQLRIGHRFIDGSSGQNTLAVAYFPGSSGLAGDVHFDNGNTWDDEPRGAIDMIEVMTHELGHALGLGHEDGTTAIMGSFYRGVFSGPGTGFLYTDDINGIRAVYGTGVGSVTPLDQRPQAISDTFVVDEDQLLTASVISNDSDPEGNGLTPVRLTNPTHGQLTFNRDGTIQYTPEADYFGADSFSYVVRAGGRESVPATVTINVKPTLDLPVAVDDEFNLPQDQVLLSGLPRETVIPAGARWRYLDDGSNQQDAWRDAGFDDGAWADGAAQLGFGDGDEVTEIGFGRNPADKHITTYFRRDFQLTAADSVSDLDVRLLRDDGAAVYVNGVEIVRDNLPSSAGFDTPTRTGVIGSAENTFFEFHVNPSTLPPSTLREGTNTLAVEVHQEGPTSPDLSFDLRLDVRRDNSRAVTANDLDPDLTGLTAILHEPPEFGGLDLLADGSLRYEPTPGFTGTDRFTYSLESATPATLVADGSPWRFLDDGSDQGTRWQDIDFDDAPWSSGGGQLGYGDGDEFTLVRFGGDPTAKHATTYFRRTFYVESAEQLTSLTADILRDDAAAVYLNGVEVYRDGNLSAAARFDTFANSNVADENAFERFAVDPRLLVDGANVLAVEVHQRSADSTDLSFDFALSGVVVSRTATVTIQVLPNLVGDTNGDGVVNIDDLNNVRNNFGGAGEGVLGDTNGDGLVNIDDLNNVRNNFGAGAIDPPAAASTAVTPRDSGPSASLLGSAEAEERIAVISHPRRVAVRHAVRLRAVDRDPPIVRAPRTWDVALSGVLDEIATLSRIRRR